MKPFKSRKRAKLFAEITVITLLIGILIFPCSHASQTASVTLQSSGTISASSSTPTSALALHTSGTEILNVNNQSFYLKGVGVWSFAPSNIFWGTSGSDNYGDQWQTGANLNESLKQTFADLTSVWGVNMIRVFFYPEWWWQGNVTPNTVDPGDSYSTTPINVRLYFQILCQIAGEYGVYVDIVPYQLTAQTGAYGYDPYLDAGGGVPMTGTWDTTQQAFITSTGYATEGAFWTAFWSAMATSLRAYPNAIFEAWNEPADQDTSPNTVTPGYLSYLTTMYDAIRSTGSTNLIFMQYQVGWEPNGWGMNIAWAGQITAAIGSPTNLAFTTHIYYYSPADLTNYWDSNGLDSDAGGIPDTAAQLQTIFTNLKSSMGVSAPLVFNEAGDCSYYATDITNDYTWWNNFCQAAYADDIGVGAYYFDRNNSAGGVAGVNMGLISTAPYTPSVPFGIDFIADITSGASGQSTVGTDLTAGFSVLPSNVTFSNILSAVYQLDTWTGTNYETTTTINAIIPRPSQTTISVE